MDAEREARLGGSRDCTPVRRLLVVRQRRVDGGREGPKNRSAVSPELAQPGLTALGRGGRLYRRLIPPERLSAGRRVGHDKHCRGDLELAQHRPGVLEHAEISIVERDGGEVT